MRADAVPCGIPPHILPDGAEAYCRRLAQISGMQIVSGRVCSTFGPMEAPTASRKNMSTVHDLIFAALEGREIKAVRPEIKRNWTHI